MTSVEPKQHDAIFKRSPQMAFRQIDDQVLLIPIVTEPTQKHGIYTLNETAAKMWLLIDGEKTIHNIATNIAREFEVDLKTALDDTQLLLADLESAGAVMTNNDVD